MVVFASLFETRRYVRGFGQRVVRIQLGLYTRVRQLNIHNATFTHFGKFSSVTNLFS